MKPERVEPVRYSQGKLLAWNAETFANEVEFSDGARGTNLPVKSAANALGFAPGQTVALLGANGSYWIDGQIITPGTGAAEDAIAFLRTSLAKQIVDELVEELLTSPAGEALAAFVIGARVHSADVGALETTSSASYTDLATAGPSVSGVEITSRGRALVWVGAGTAATSANGSPSFGQKAAMSYAISGATSASALDSRSMSFAFTDLGGDAFGTVRASAASLVTGLNEGSHTFTAKYRKVAGDGAVQFDTRHIAVMAF